MTDSDERDERGARAIASRLDELFANVRPPGRGPYTNDDIAARAGQLGYDISSVYIQQLRRGKRANPTVHALEAVAAAFGVPLSYFFTDTSVTRSREDRALAAALGDDVVRDIALRSAQLTPEGAQAISAVLRNLERLPGITRYATDTPPAGSDPDPEELTGGDAR